MIRRKNHFVDLSFCDKNTNFHLYDNGCSSFAYAKVTNQNCSPTTDVFIHKRFFLIVPLTASRDHQRFSTIQCTVSCIL